MSELLKIVPMPVLVFIIVLIVISLVVMAFSYLKNRTLEKIRTDVYQLILKAEEKYKASSEGKQKMKWVVQQARLILPSWMQTIMSDEALERVIQVWFDGIKDLLDDGKMNGSQKADQ
jgi:hypothetical protein